MADSPQVFYWDSDVFISRFQRTPGRIETLEKITEAAEKNRVQLVISTYSLTEIAKVPGIMDSNGNPVTLTEKELELLSGYFENDFIVIRPLSQIIAEMAREYVAKFGLKPGDAVHVATATRAFAKSVLPHWA